MARRQENKFAAFSQAQTPAFAKWYCAGFGAGFSPVMPGTAGSLVGLALGAAVLHYSTAALMVAAMAVALTGYLAIKSATSTDEANADPGWIVVDEIAGQMLAMSVAQRGRIWHYALAFAFFRFFDIMKFGPVGWADRRSGAFGIMADDVVAGILAALCLAAARALL